VSLLKSNAIGGVFHHFFDLVAAGKTADPFKFDLRSDTTVYFFPAADRCVVVFGIDFIDETDKVIAKIFLQEFVDARRGLGQAPPCMWGVAPPQELRHYNITENQGILGYLSFALLKNHVGRGKDQAVKTLQTFRNYLQYHIKCSRSYFHSRMRARVSSLTQVLSRAQQEAVAAKEKKTATGRTFKRQ